MFGQGIRLFPSNHSIDVLRTLPRRIDVRGQGRRVAPTSAIRDGRTWTRNDYNDVLYLWQRRPTAMLSRENDAGRRSSTTRPCQRLQRTYAQRKGCWPFSYDQPPDRAERGVSQRALRAFTNARSTAVTGRGFRFDGVNGRATARNASGASSRTHRSSGDDLAAGSRQPPGPGG